MTKNDEIIKKTLEFATRWYRYEKKNSNLFGQVTDHTFRKGNAKSKFVSSL